jgi:hypothetical protein
VDQGLQPRHDPLSEARAYFAQGLLWLPIDKEGLIGLEPKNGSERKQWKTRGKHCATPVATEKFFLAPECEFTDFADGTQTRARMFKSACRQPFIPANGLLYTFPVQCECSRCSAARWDSRPTSRSAKRSAARSSRRARRRPPPRRPCSNRPPDDWPIYRHDAYRSGSTPAGLRRAEVKRAWETSIATLPEGTVPRSGNRIRS